MNKYTIFIFLVVCQSITFKVYCQVFSQSFIEGSSLFFDPTVKSIGYENAILREDSPNARSISIATYNPSNLTFNTKEKKVEFNNFARIRIDSTNNFLGFGFSGGGKLDSELSKMLENSNFVGGAIFNSIITYQSYFNSKRDTARLAELKAEFRKRPYNKEIIEISRLLDIETYEGIINEKLIDILPDSIIDNIINSNASVANKLESIKKLLKEKLSYFIKKRQIEYNKIDRKFDSITNYLTSYQGLVFYAAGGWEGRSFKSYNSSLPFEDQIANVNNTLSSYTFGMNYFNMNIGGFLTLLGGASISYQKVDNFSGLKEITVIEGSSQSNGSLVRNSTRSLTAYTGEYDDGIARFKYSLDSYLVPIGFEAAGLHLNLSINDPIDNEISSTTDVNLGLYFLKESIFSPKIGLILSFQDVTKRIKLPDQGNRFSFGIVTRLNFGEYSFKK